MCRCEGYGFQAVCLEQGIEIRKVGYWIGCHFQGTDQFIKDVSLD